MEKNVATSSYTKIFIFLLNIKKYYIFTEHNWVFQFIQQIPIPKGSHIFLQQLYLSKQKQTSNRKYIMVSIKILFNKNTFYYILSYNDYFLICNFLLFIFYLFIYCYYYFLLCFIYLFYFFIMYLFYYFSFFIHLLLHLFLFFIL